MCLHRSISIFVSLSNISVTAYLITNFKIPWINANDCDEDGEDGEDDEDDEEKGVKGVRGV